MTRSKVFPKCLFQRSDFDALSPQLRVIGFGLFVLNTIEGRLETLAQLHGTQKAKEPGSDITWINWTTIISALFILMVTACWYMLRYLEFVAVKENHAQHTTSDTAACCRILEIKLPIVVAFCEAIRPDPANDEFYVPCMQCSLRFKAHVQERKFMYSIFYFGNLNREIPIHHF